MEVYKILLYLPVHKNIMLEGFFSKVSIHFTQNITNFLLNLIKDISFLFTFLTLHLVTKVLYALNNLQFFKVFRKINKFYCKLCTKIL